VNRVLAMRGIAATEMPTVRATATAPTRVTGLAAAPPDILGTIRRIRDGWKGSGR
jgi:hypothetical protein